MNPERSSLRGLLARLGAVLLGAAVLYAAGAGPASYYKTRFENTMGAQGSPALMHMMRTTYRPLETGMQGTSLQGALAEYQLWWSQRAAKQYPPPFYPYSFDRYDDPGICFTIGPD